MKRAFIAAAIGGVIAICALGILFVVDSYSTQMRGNVGFQAYISSGNKDLLPPNSLDKRLDLLRDPYQKIAWEMLAYVWLRERVDWIIEISLGSVLVGFLIGALQAKRLAQTSA